MDKRSGARGLIVGIAGLFLLFGLPGVAHADGPVRITGTVTNQTGGGVLNVSVTATAPGGSTVLFGPSLTGVSGAYQLDVDPGTYDIHFDPPSGSGLNPITNNNLAVQSDRMLNVQLIPPSHTISGVVRDGDGVPVPSVTVTYRTVASPDSPVSATTNTSGAYVITANAGVYYLGSVTGNAPQPLGAINVNNVQGGSAMPPYDLTNTDLVQDFQLPTTTLAVTVKDSFGIPVPSATITITNNTSATGPFSIATGQGALYRNSTNRTAATNSLGTATLTTFKATYPTGLICTTVNANQICNTTTLTISGPTSLLFQAAPQAPPAPTGLHADASPTRLAPVLSWNAVSVAASYRVYRNGAQVGTTTTTGFTDSALNVSGTFTYTVTAVSALNIESSGSAPVTVLYSADGPFVTNLGVTPGSVTVGHTATLSATATDEIAGVSAAEYFEGTDPGEGHGTAMAVAGTTITATIPATLAIGSHTFTVRARNSLGNWTRGTLPTTTLTVAQPVLNGRVLNGANQALAGVTIDVLDPADHSIVRATTTTDANGNYAASVSPGTYDVKVTPPGTVYLPTTKTGVNLTDNATLDVVLVLAPTTFRGTVLDGNQQPIPGATVSLHNPGGQTFTATTASDGSFDVQVNPAAYSLTISGTKAAAPLAMVPTTFSLSGGAFDLTHDDDKVLTVRAVTVTFTTRSALTGATVSGVALSVAASTETSLYDGSATFTGSATYPATTDQNGVAAVVVLAGSQLTVSATPGAGGGVIATQFPPTVVIDEDAPIDLPLTADIKRFSGTLKDNANHGVSGATIRLSGPLGTFSATTDADGAFTVEAAAGTYTLSLDGSRPGGASPPAVPDSFSANGGPVNLTNGDWSQDLTLATATVSVTAQSGFGSPLAGVSIQLASASGSISLYPGATSSASATSTRTTDATGVAQLLVLTGLTYTTKATPPAGSGYLVTNLGPSPVVTGDTAWTISLDRDLKSFSGAVRDGSGTPVANATVQLDGNEQDQHYAAVTNDLGVFTLQVAPSPAYSLRVSGSHAGSPSAVLPDTFVLSGAASVTEDTVRDVTVAAVTLSILARDDRGAPVGSVSIVFSSSGSQNGYAASSANIGRTTGPDGRTSVLMLRGTTYVISATPPANTGYINTTFDGTSPITQDAETVIELQNHIPTGLSATSPTRSSPALTWNPVVNTDHYIVYRGTTAIGPVTTASFVDSALATDGTYLYRVASVSADGYESPKSAAVSVLYDTTAPLVGDPALSVNPKLASETTTLSATVADAGAGVGAGEYFLGATDPGPGQGIAMVLSGGSLTATIGTDLVAGAYQVNVRARDVLGTWSDPRVVQLTVSRPVAPSGLVASSPVNHDPVLSWTASPDAVAYAVYRDGIRLADQPTGTGYTDAGRPDGTYTYTVRAVDALGDESDPAGPVDVLVDTTKPTVDTPSWTTNPIAPGGTSTVTAGVTDPAPAPSGVVGGEYFVDTDPGAGQGTPMTLADASLTATLGASLAVGGHLVGIRAVDAAGNWSTAATTTLTVTDPANADVAITAGATPDPAALGNTYTFTLSVTNSGPQAAPSVSTSTAFTGAARLVFGAAASQGSCTNGTTLACDLGPLAAGATATVTVTVEPQATGSVTATSTVSAALPDPQPANNTAVTTTTVTNSLGCTIIGTPGNDTLNGANGNDVICALGGDDTVTGGNGDDTIFGGSGNDNLDGGNGNDTIFGGDGNSVLTGGNGNDVITGGDGVDIIHAGNGDDTVNAGGGNDTIEGGNGNDTINAGAGDDTVDGGNGTDTCPNTEHASSCAP